MVGSWYATSGTPTIDNTNPEAPVMTNAKNTAIAGNFTGGTLTNVGDQIVLSGGVTFSNAPSSTTYAAQAFRFGLFDVDGTSGNTGWLGYWVGTSTTGSAGALDKKPTGNTSVAISGTGATVLASPTAGSTVEFDTTQPYTYSLDLTRLSGGSVDIDYTLTDSAGYTLSGDFVDATPQTYTFNRVSFLVGGDMPTGVGANFSNVDATFTPAPEPSATVLGGLGLIGLLCRRRRA